MNYPTIEQFIGHTPLVRLQRISAGENNTILLKLEGNNPAGSVKDRAAINMIQAAEAAGEIQPGDTLIEATSGNTGIALSMAAAIKGYRMILIMPAHMSEERRAIMKAYGATLISVTQEQGMEGARDLAEQMVKEGHGYALNQFANVNNPGAHFQGTGPEIWRDTAGEISHFISAMGTTGTIVGTGRYLKEKKPHIQIIGVQPQQGANIPGIRRWPAEYLPKIFDPSVVDRVIDVSQQQAEDMSRRLAREEGIFVGISSGGGLSAAVQVAEQVANAVIVSIVCDRGDRYLSTGVFS